MAVPRGCHSLSCIGRELLLGSLLADKVAVLFFGGIQAEVLLCGAQDSKDAKGRGLVASKDGVYFSRTHNGPPSLAWEPALWNTRELQTGLALNSAVKM